jgi:hypothetical protein
MANSRNSGAKHQYATVDTDPGDGYFTNTVSPRALKDDIFFSVRETDPEASDFPSGGSTMTVVLQFRCAGDTAWQSYNYNTGTAFVAGDRFNITDFGSGVNWRAGVLAGGYTEGSLTFGFDW